MNEERIVISAKIGLVLGILFLLLTIGTIVWGWPALAAEGTPTGVSHSAQVPVPAPTLTKKIPAEALRILEGEEKIGTHCWIAQWNSKYLPAPILAVFIIWIRPNGEVAGALVYNPHLLKSKEVLRRLSDDEKFRERSLMEMLWRNDQKTPWYNNPLLNKIFGVKGNPFISK